MHFQAIALIVGEHDSRAPMDVYYIRTYDGTFGRSDGSWDRGFDYHRTIHPNDPEYEPWAPFVAAYLGFGIAQRDLLPPLPEPFSNH